MTFLIDRHTRDTSFNIYSNSSAIFNFFFTSYIFRLLFRRTRDWNQFNDHAKFKSVSRARLFTFRSFTGFVRMVFASVISNVCWGQVFAIHVWPIRTVIWYFCRYFYSWVTATSASNSGGFAFKAGCIDYVFSIYRFDVYGEEKRIRPAWGIIAYAVAVLWDNVAFINLYDLDVRLFFHRDARHFIGIGASILRVCVVVWVFRSATMSQ